MTGNDVPSSPAPGWPNGERRQERALPSSAEALRCRARLAREAARQDRGLGRLCRPRLKGDQRQIAIAHDGLHAGADEPAWRPCGEAIDIARLDQRDHLGELRGGIACGVSREIRRGGQHARLRQRQPFGALGRRACAARWRAFADAAGAIDAVSGRLVRRCRGSNPPGGRCVGVGVGGPLPSASILAEGLPAAVALVVKDGGSDGLGLRAGLRAPRPGVIRLRSVCSFVCPGRDRPALRHLAKWCKRASRPAGGRKEKASPVLSAVLASGKW